MPTRDDHIVAAHENERFVSFLLGADRSDSYAWAVSGLFYAAVHCGRAYLLARGVPRITSHRAFEVHFVRISTDSRLFPFYRRLKDESERARYDCARYTRAEVEQLDHEILTPLRDAVT